MIIDTHIIKVNLVFFSVKNENNLGLQMNISCSFALLLFYCRIVSNNCNPHVVYINNFGFACVYVPFWVRKNIQDSLLF